MDWREAIDAREQTRRDYQAKLEAARKAKHDAERTKRARRMIERQQVHEFPKL